MNAETSYEEPLTWLSDPLEGIRFVQDKIMRGHWDFGGHRQNLLIIIMSYLFNQNH